MAIGPLKESVVKEVERAFKSAGLGQSEIDSFVRDHNETAEHLDRGVCPMCKSGPIRRTLDPRQTGTTQSAGSWFNYRCPCGFMLDVKEEPN